MFSEKLSAEMQKFADPERAAQQKRYLKSPFRFIGIRKPEINRIAAGFRKANRSLDAAALEQLLRELWQSDSHDNKSLAITILQKYPKIITPEFFPQIDAMIDDCTGWDHLDELAIHVIGPYFVRYPAELTRVRNWADSDIMWRRRASIISQLKELRQGKGEITLFLAICAGRLDETEFFIRKAIGWALRELGEKKPELVAEFVQLHRDRFSGLSFREATRKLPAEVLQKYGLTT